MSLQNKLCHQQAYSVYKPHEMSLLSPQKDCIGKSYPKIIYFIHIKFGSQWYDYFKDPAVSQEKSCSFFILYYRR